MLGLLLAAVATSAVIIVSGRVWLVFPVFLVTCLYIVCSAFTSVGYVAAHPADEMDPDALPVGTILLGAAAALLAGLFGLASVLGARRPVPRSATGRKGRGTKASPRS